MVLLPPPLLPLPSLIQTHPCGGNTQLEYVINGDFYNGGTTSALASGLPIGPGQTGRVTLSLHGSRVPPHLQYFYDHKTLSLSSAMA